MRCNIPYEDLVTYADDDLDAGRLEEIRHHVAQCPSCQQRLEALKQVDTMLAESAKAQPPAEAVLAARRAIAQALGRGHANEMMTLEEVAEFLRLNPQQLGEIVEELPAFELAGQIRVRRERLMQWVQQRERDYSRQTGESWVARARVLAPGIGVAS